jgi:hypothetical protein
MLITSMCAFAQDYKRPTANAASDDTNAGNICYSNALNENNGVYYLPASSMSAVYTGKSGSGPISSPNSSLSLAGGYGNPYWKQAIFSGWQSASGSYSALTLNVNLACTLGSGDNYPCGMAYTLDGGSTWAYPYNPPGGASQSTSSFTIPANTPLSSIKVSVCTWGYNPDSLSVYDIWTTGVLQGNPPSISGLSPNFGAAGSSVTLTGAGFGSSQGASTVAFNGTTAAISSWSDTSIVATVPTIATSGNAVVTVGGVASNGVGFTVTTPTIASLNPSSGNAGSVVNISGSGFGVAEGQSTVRFNGVLAGVLYWSDSSITAVVPSNTTTGNATTGPVVVTLANGQTSNNNIIFTVNNSPCP